MIKLRLWGLPEEVRELVEYFKANSDLRVTYVSEPCEDRPRKGESMSKYVRVYMELTLQPPATVEIVVEDKGECPYKGTTENGKEYCILCFTPTNGAVQCAFEYEDCYFYRHCEKYKKRNAGAEE